MATCDASSLAVFGINERDTISTVLDLSFVYVQRCQEFTLFPVIEAGEHVASQAFVGFVSQPGWGIAFVVGS